MNLEMCAENSRKRFIYTSIRRNKKKPEHFYCQQNYSTFAVIIRSPAIPCISRLGFQHCPGYPKATTLERASFHLLGIHYHSISPHLDSVLLPKPQWITIWGKIVE